MVDSSFTVLGRLANLSLSGIEFRKACMDALSDVPGYDWCGVYRLEVDHLGATKEDLRPQFLMLDAYVGAATEHDRIPIGRGVCGTAVATGENQLVDDVRELDNYLACSLETRSEIVVLIRKASNPKTILGQIDIDSHEVGRFTKSDEHFLEGMAALMAERW